MADIRELVREGVVDAPPTEWDKGKREEMGEKGTIFTITSGAMSMDNESRALMQFVGKCAGEPITFRLYLNGKRDAFLLKVAELAAAEPVDGLRLHTYREGKGSPRVELEPAS